MAVKISELPAAETPLTGDELIEAVQNGQNVKLTADNIAALASGGSVTINGTSGRISISAAGSTYTVNIDAAYAGQASITTLGNVTTGTWNGTAIADGKIASAATWNAKAGTISPAFTGIPTAPTATAGTSTTQIATTEFVEEAKLNLPGTGDRVVIVNTAGQPSANNQVVSAWITDTSDINELTQVPANWNGSGAWIGPALNSVFGNIYVGSDSFGDTYEYKFKSNGTPYRISI